jgi:hypothetical protein
MSEHLSPERAVRLLLAKSGELETMVRNEMDLNGPPLRPVTALAADIALIATLLAEHIERSECGEHDDQGTLDALVQPFREGFDEGRPE